MKTEKATLSQIGLNTRLTRTLLGRMNKPRVASVAGMELHTSGWVPPSDLYAQVLNNRAHHMPTMEALGEAGLFDIFKETPALQAHLDGLFGGFSYRTFGWMVDKINPFHRALTIFRSVVGQDKTIAVNMGSVKKYTPFPEKEGGLNMTPSRENGSFIDLARKKELLPVNCLGVSILLTTLLRMAGLEAGLKYTENPIDFENRLVDHAYVIATIGGKNLMMDASFAKIESTTQSADLDNRAYAAYICNKEAPDEDKVTEGSLGKLEIAAQIDPSYRYVWTKLGNVYKYHKRTTLAIKCFEKAVGLNHGAMHPLLCLGAYYFDAGEYAAARQYFEKALEIVPHSKSAKNNLASAYKLLGDLGKAEELFLEILSIDPKFAPALHNLGDLYLTMREFDKALAFAKRGVEIDPGYWGGWLNLGKAHGRRGERNLAEDSFQKALALDPNIASTWAEKGENLLLMGNNQEAMEHFKKAIELSPADLNYRNDLGVAYAYKDDFQTAKAIFLEILDAMPGMRFALNNLGSIYVLEGKINEAIKCYEKALGFDPYDRTVWKNLVYISSKEGYSQIHVEMFNNVFGAHTDDMQAIELREKIFAPQGAPKGVEHSIGYHEEFRGKQD